MSERNDTTHAVFMKQVPTRIPGLDAVLRGGLFQGGIYMIAGAPGSGKTLLANQICYSHVKAGGQALYVTILSETHARMLAALQPMAYFDSEVLGTRMQYIGGYQVAETDRLDGLLKLLRKELRAQKSTMLVLDGLVTAHAFADSDLELKRFIHELQIMLEMLGCTALVLTGATQGLTQYSQRTMVDGLIMLTARRIGIRVIRELEVTKHRGTGQMLGGHVFDITSAGLTIYPRIESLADLQQPRLQSGPPLLTSVGIKQLDSVLSGGVIVGSTTLLAGPAGFEKLLFGLRFLMHGVHKQEPVLYLTSSETPRLHATLAHGVASGLQDAMARGQVDVLYMSSQQQTIDQIITSLLDRIDKLKIKRLFINSLAVLRATMIYADRSYDVFTALGRALQARGVTTLLTEDCEEVSNSVYHPPHFGGDISGMADYLIAIRFVMQKARRSNLLTVVAAPSHIDAFPMREFSVTKDGVEVAQDARSAQSILAGADSMQQSGSGLA